MQAVVAGQRARQGWTRQRTSELGMGAWTAGWALKASQRLPLAISIAVVQLINSCNEGIGNEMLKYAFDSGRQMNERTDGWKQRYADNKAKNARKKETHKHMQTDTLFSNCLTLATSRT